MYMTEVAIRVHVYDVHVVVVDLRVYMYRYMITGWERTGHMLCIVDTSLSVLMTLRMCLRELCCLFGIFLLFGFKSLGKGVLLTYVFIMAIFGDG